REKVFQCLESRKNVISAACRAVMTPSPPAEQPVMKKHAPQTKTAKRKGTAVKSATVSAERSASKKQPPHARSATSKAPSTKRASNSVPPQNSKPLNL